MKKLNRKGFTLVELLAVIIILAIVVGITIPAITNIINDSKNNALGVAVDAAEDYLADQYAYMNVDYTTASPNFTNVFSAPSGKDATTGKYTETTLNYTSHSALLNEMGFSKDNVSEVKAYITESGVACVRVTEITNKSEYYSTQYWNTAAAKSGDTSGILYSSAKTDANNNSKSCD